MVHHASLQKNKAIMKKFPVQVFPIHNASGKKGKHHTVNSKNTATRELPLQYTGPIFKAKKHDPL